MQDRSVFAGIYTPYDFGLLTKGSSVLLSAPLKLVRLQRQRAASCPGMASLNDQQSFMGRRSKTALGKIPVQ
jgi:hypothetical protein